MTKFQLIFGIAALMLLLVVAIFKGKATIKFLGMVLGFDNRRSRNVTTVEGNGHIVEQYNSKTDGMPVDNHADVKGANIQVKQGDHS